MLVTKSDLRKLSGSPRKLSNQLSPTQAFPQLEFQRPSLENVSTISWESPSSKKSWPRRQFLTSAGLGPADSGLSLSSTFCSSAPSGWEVSLGLEGSAGREEPCHPPGHGGPAGCIVGTFWLSCPASALFSTLLLRARYSTE